MAAAAGGLREEGREGCGWPEGGGVPASTAAAGEKRTAVLATEDADKWTSGKVWPIRH